MNATFHPSADSCAAFDFIEVEIRLPEPVGDAFGDVTITAALVGPDRVARKCVGFCDSTDGRLHRVRLMPMGSGEYVYTIMAVHNGVSSEFLGGFVAMNAGRKGMLRADGWGWKWSGTGEPFFWNSTTAYLLAGLRDDLMLAAIDRLADAGVNRIRVALCPSRQRDGGRWYEPQVTPDDDFTFCYCPWVCAQPDVWDDPQPDTTRFDLEYWRKFERLLSRARERGMIVQVIFFVDAQETQNYPFTRPAPKPDGARDFDDTTCPPDELEHRYFAYAAARLSAFCNVEWCITNEWALFQSNAWVDRMGTYLHRKDPYHHPLSVHGHGHFPFRNRHWCTHALFQVWDDHEEFDAYAWMLAQRAAQEATGRIIPQINEEYGYEDHYPGPWGGGRTAPTRDAESRLRLAWEMTMAGGHVTTGESAAAGGHVGGWINGLGADDTLLKSLAKRRAFFEAIPNWQTLEPTRRFVLENRTHRVVYDSLTGAARLEEKTG